MKTRTALIYLAVFLILGGYFYYFEVVRREAHLEREEVARHLFQVDKDQISALTLQRAESKAISLEKKGSWRIAEPLSSRADSFAVSSLLTTLDSLKLEREVESTVEDLKPYGLDKPRLQLSFLAAGTWHHLSIGDKAPVGDQFYASADEPNRVLLVPGTEWQPLDKTLFDLRGKELFTLKSEDVDRIEIDRSDEKIIIARVEKDRWQAPNAPEVKVKTSKVESLLNELIWLRARQFLEEEADIARHGLAPPRIRVSLSSPEKTETLLIGDTNKDEALSVKGEELPGMAMVDGDLLKGLPQQLSDLEDRTLLEFQTEEILALTLELNGEAARLKRTEQGWTWVDDGDRKEPENWKVNSLLWKVQELEHQVGTHSNDRSPPEQSTARLVLFAKDARRLGGLIMPEVRDEKQERAVFWFSKGMGEAQPHWTNSESLLSLRRSMEELIALE
ncbi:MAG: DUF4340 domain-containing protein [Deltaproteobacteria bacterium]|nr:MAG: DUF4340 domain-containing protein [Deltaproteobacteria bacterium]